MFWGSRITNTKWSFLNITKNHSGQGTCHSQLLSPPSALTFSLWVQRAQLLPSCLWREQAGVWSWLSPTLGISEVWSFPGPQLLKAMVLLHVFFWIWCFYWRQACSNIKVIFCLRFCQESFHSWNDDSPAMINLEKCQIDTMLASYYGRRCMPCSGFWR